MEEDFNEQLFMNLFVGLLPRVSGKLMYIVYDPQPAPGDVITLTNYYTTLASNKDFKRHVTWLSGHDDASGVARV
jgi:hypothetical protein